MLVNNGFLIMDGFADAGFLTLGLDYFRGVRQQSIHDSCRADITGPRLEASKEPI